MNTMNGINSFVRPEMTRFKGYAACKSPDVIAKKLGIPVENIVKLDANENNYGPSPAVSAALGTFDGYHIYPDAAQTELRNLLSGYTGMPAEQIVAGAGSDQLIDLLVKLFTGPGDEIINMGPSFAMYRF
jgi:histidinol-phosphate aminotransferase